MGYSSRIEYQLENLLFATVIKAHAAFHTISCNVEKFHFSVIGVTLGPTVTR